MSLSSRAIVSLDEAKRYLGGLGWNDVDAVFLEGDDNSVGWIDLASYWLEETIDNKVKPQEVEEMMDGSGDTIQELPYFPVIQIAGDDATAQLANLRYRTSWDGDWTNLLTNINAVFYDPHRKNLLTLINGSLFPAGSNNLKVKWIAGYAPSDIPGTIKLVVLEKIFTIWKESGKGASRLGKSSSSASAVGAGGSDSYVDMLARWDKMLKPFQKRGRSIISQVMR